MNRFLLQLGLSLFFTTGVAHAQFTQFGAGLSLANGAEVEVNEQVYQNQSFGLSTDVHYALGKHLFMVPGVQFFLPKKETFANGGESRTTLMNLNMDLFYYFAPQEKISAYVVGGVNLGFWHIKDQHETSWFGSVDTNTWQVKPGASAGLGIRFALGYRANLYSQARFVMGSAGQLIWTNGLQFTID